MVTFRMTFVLGFFMAMAMASTKTMGGEPSTVAIYPNAGQALGGDWLVGRSISYELENVMITSILAQTQLGSELSGILGDSQVGFLDAWRSLLEWDPFTYSLLAVAGDRYANLETNY